VALPTSTALSQHCQIELPGDAFSIFVRPPCFCGRSSIIAAQDLLAGNFSAEQLSQAILALTSDYAVRQRSAEGALGVWRSGTDIQSPGGEGLASLLTANPTLRTNPKFVVAVERPDVFAAEELADPTTTLAEIPREYEFWARKWLPFLRGNVRIVVCLVFAAGHFFVAKLTNAGVNAGKITIKAEIYETKGVVTTSGRTPKQAGINTIIRDTMANLARPGAIENAFLRPILSSLENIYPLLAAEIGTPAASSRARPQSDALGAPTQAAASSSGPVRGLAAARGGPPPARSSLRRSSAGVVAAETAPPVRSSSPRAPAPDDVAGRAAQSGSRPNALRARIASAAVVVAAADARARSSERGVSPAANPSGSRRPRRRPPTQIAAVAATAAAEAATRTLQLVTAAELAVMAANIEEGANALAARSTACATEAATAAAALAATLDAVVQPSPPNRASSPPIVQSPRATGARLPISSAAAAIVAQ
jgi:hypothetical protein